MTVFPLSVFSALAALHSPLGELATYRHPGPPAGLSSSWSRVGLGPWSSVRAPWVTAASGQRRDGQSESAQAQACGCGGRRGHRAPRPARVTWGD